MFGWLVADGWCWFVLREKYCWLLADKPSEQAGYHPPLVVPGDYHYKSTAWNNLNSTYDQNKLNLEAK
jgi:hypothetical protein